MAQFPAIYRAKAVQSTGTTITAFVPQVFGDVPIEITDFLGSATAGMGWVFFQGGNPDFPVWTSGLGGGGGNGGGGGGGGSVAGYPAYYAQTINVSVNNTSGGVTEVTLLDGSIEAVYDGWIEIVVSGGYAGMSITGPVNARQAVYSPGYLDPTGQPWISFGRIQNVMPNQWDLIGDCQLNLPVSVSDKPVVRWQGNWSPSTYMCSFRSYVSLKWFSDSPIVTSGSGGMPGPPGPGIPNGGTPGQILVKNTASDYDTTWVTVAGLVTSYRHIQTIPAAVWNIVHNLGFYPNVSVVDSSHREVVGEIEYLDMNTVRLTFSAAFGGEAYLS